MAYENQIYEIEKHNNGFKPIVNQASLDKDRDVPLIYGGWNNWRP